MKSYPGLIHSPFLKIIPLIFILIIGAGLLSYQIKLPYSKILEHGTLEIRARNFLQVGFLDLHFLPTRNLLTGKPNFYLNHPPLFIILLALSLRILGDSEISARLLVIISSLGSVVLLYKIILRETTLKLALWTAFLTILLPIFFYYGRVVNYDPFTLFISLLVIWLFLNYSKERNFFLRLPLFIAVGAGVLLDWPFYFTPPALFIYALIRRQKRFLALGTIVTAGAIFSLMLWYYSFAVNEWGGALTIFKGTAQYTKFSSARDILWLKLFFYSTLFERTQHCFTFLIPFLALVGITINFFNIQNQNNRKSLALSVLLLFNGFGFIILAPSYLLLHDWGLYMLIPAASFLSAQAIIKFPMIIRGAILLLFIALATHQFQYFHGSSDMLPTQIGRAIHRVSESGDTLLAPRGPPIAYYTRLPSQFLWPGLDSIDFISRYQPTWVVFNRNNIFSLQTSLEEVYACLIKEGYQQIYQGIFEVWTIADITKEELLPAFLPAENI